MLLILPFYLEFSAISRLSHEYSASEMALSLFYGRYAKSSRRSGPKFEKERRGRETKNRSIIIRIRQLTAILL